MIKKRFTDLSKSRLFVICFAMISCFLFMDVTNLSAATITLQPSDKGRAVVSSKVRAKSCGINCSNFPNGTAVTLTALPKKGFLSSGWGGGCSTLSPVSPVQLTLGSGSLTCSATFTFAGSRLIGPTGGTVFTSDMKASVVIPSGALTVPTTITATPLLGPLPAPAIGAGVEFLPSGTTFAKSVTITIAYDPALIPAGVAESNLCIVYLVGAGWSTEGLGSCTVNTAAKTVTTTTKHFTTFVVTAGGKNLTVTTAGTGIGTVTSSTNFNSVPPIVTLTATPNLGSIFSGWIVGSGCSGTTCIVTMNADKSVAAIFSTKISAGYVHTCAITTLAGGVKCWGLNSAGQLGDRLKTDSNTPVDVSGISNVVAIAAGGGHTCALKTGGGVQCWGDNYNGQLGDGAGGPNHISLTPVNVSGLDSNVVAIAAGFYHTCVLTTAGGVKCWGNNYNGQVGDGTTTNRPTPVDVSGLTSGVVAIATGFTHTCALTTAGGVKCWGDNYTGQLGDGTDKNNKLAPVDVSGLSNVVAITAGLSHTCALTTKGKVQCWGYNVYGQIGDGTTKENRRTPVNVEGLPTVGVTAIAAGGNHTCALYTMRSDVYCWGWNGQGQLGDGTNMDSPTPVLSKGIGTIIALGTYHICALLSSDEVKCWGGGVGGQLGNGKNTNSSIPVSLATADALAIFARECDRAIGVTVPDFDSDDSRATAVLTEHFMNSKGMELEPKRENYLAFNPMNPLASNRCDRPNRLNQECDPGSRFRVLIDTNEAYIVAHSRKQGLGAGQYGDIAVIQHNKKNGATCFYQGALDKNQNGNVKAPSKGVDAVGDGESAFWWTPQETADSGCVKCHDNGPIIRSPYLTQITGRNKLPGAGDNTFNRDQPYYFVGAAFASWKAYKVEVKDNMCNSCHRMGVNTVNTKHGTGRHLAIMATEATQNSKNQHSKDSPLWMLRGEEAFNQANFNAAMDIKKCAEKFRGMDITHGDCKITQFTGEGRIQSPFPTPSKPPPAYIQCTNCHGNNAEGGTIGLPLRPLLKMNNGEVTFIDVVQKGRGAMPQFKSKDLSPGALDSIIVWLRGTN